MSNLTVFEVIGRTAAVHEAGANDPFNIAKAAVDRHVLLLVTPSIQITGAEHYQTLFAC